MPSDDNIEESSRRNKAERIYADALNVADLWHQERLEWTGRGIQWLLLAHGGGAVATAAYIGVAQANAHPIANLLWALGSFLVGILLLLAYALMRLIVAQGKVYYLKAQRKKIRRNWNYEEANRTRLNRPPVRPQIWAGLAVCLLEFLLFAFGAGAALVGLMS